MDLGELPLRPHARRHRLWQLALVSSKWWKMVDLSTIFWSDIAFKLDDVRLYLRKSRNALLNIKCVSLYGDAAKFMEIAATAAHRWKSIALSCTFGEDLVQLLRSPMPELTDMQITVRTRSELSEGHSLLQLQDLPRLNHLCLDNVDIQWGNVQLECLLSLQLANIQATALSLGRLLSILQSSPDLEQLALSNVHTTIDGVPLRTGICLRRLRRLQLATMPPETLEYLVAAIDSPQLIAIKLVGCPDSYFVGNTNNAAQAPLMKYLPSIVGKPEEIRITNDLRHSQIEITSGPPFGKGKEWVSRATSSGTVGLHITVPTEDARRSLERVITLLSEAGLHNATRGRVRLCFQGFVDYAGDLPVNYEGCFDARLLARLPTITHISAVDPTDVRCILQHLGQCRQGTDGTWSYPCPRLQVLDIGGTNEKVEQRDIETFLSGRYADGQPFYQGTHLVTRPPYLEELILPLHLEGDLDAEGLEEADSMEM